MLIAWLEPLVLGGSGQSDPLPSWNDGPSKAAIVAVVTAVTTASPQASDGAEAVHPLLKKEKTSRVDDSREETLRWAWSMRL